MTGSMMLLFTGTLGYLMVRFHRFHSIKIAFAFFLLVNLLFFVRFRDKGQGFVERFMRSDFFPRKLAITKVGRFLVLISIGIGFAAVNTGSNLLYLLMSMLLSIIMASGILSELSIRNIAMTPRFPPVAVAGQETLFPLDLTSLKRRFSSFTLEGRVLFRQEEPAPSQVPGVLLKLPPLGSGHLFPRVTFPRRGIYPVSGFALATSYPFSFFQKSRHEKRREDIVVLPRGDRDITGLLAGMGHGQEELAGRSGRGAEFFSARPMFAGDEWRDVHWKLSARSQHFAVKEYEALATRRVHLVLCGGSGETKDAVDAGEAGVELAAAVIRQLLTQSFEVGVRAGTKFRQEPAGGERGLQTLYRQLAWLSLDDVPDAPDLSGIPPGDEVLVVHLVQQTVQRPGAGSSHTVMKEGAS